MENVEKVQKQAYAEPTLQKRQQLLEVTQGVITASGGATSQPG